MPFKQDFDLPTEEDLAVEEINVSMAALYASALHLGKICEKQNNEFMLCKQETKDPRKCIEEGKEVTFCALEFFQKLKKECYDEFNQYAQCLHKSSTRWTTFSACRKTQGVYDKCVLDKLGIERPHYAWNSQIHVHETERERPESDQAGFPGAAQKYVPPAPENRKKPRYETRLMK